MVSLVRFGCIFSATIVGWTIVGLVLLIPLAAVLPRDLALAAGLLAGGTGAYVTLVRTRRLGSPKATTEPIANRDQHAELPLEGMQPTQSGIDPPGAATPADPSNPLALEAEQVIAMSRGAIPMVATPAMSRTIWSWRLGGVLMGILITVLVYFPAGEPDAGEVTWALALFTVIAGMTIGSGLRNSGSPRIFLAGEAIRGLGIGSAVGLALLLIIPMIWLLVTGRIM